MEPARQHNERSTGHAAEPAPPEPHVLVFPFPVQGHITAMLKLAELLSLVGVRVTFLNTDHYHLRLLRFAGVGDRLARRPGLRLRSIPDGLPDDNPRDADCVMQMVESMNATVPPFFREILSSSGGVDDPDKAPPVTLVVADLMIGFAVDVAEELGIPIVAFRTSSACSFWAYYCVPKLISAGKIPFQDGCDLDELVACVPGTESFLRRRDLPSFCRAKDLTDPIFQFVSGMTRNATRYRGLVFNTAEFAEASVLPHIRAQLPPTYPIGPLHALLKAVETNTASETGDGTSNSASLWEEDRDCMAWLESRPSASVIYVSFGSIALLKREQLLEFWHGLVNSGHHFLWVVRLGLVAGEGGGGGGGVPEEVAEATRERGFLVGWAPQQEVLAHPAVGCFLTHSGWNSTLESMWAGVPMVCWPFFSDQHINSRFVSEVWGIGLDLKDTCDRVIVENALREVMAGEGRGTQIRGAAAAVAKKMRESVAEGGPSHMNLQGLINVITSLG